MDMFVTVLYAELEEASGTVRFVNAGHCEPIVTDAGGQVRLLKRSGNPPLGVMPDRAFAECNLTLAPGEMLFLYTDGVTEAVNRDGDQFRAQRLLDTAQRFAGRSPQELMLAVVGDVESFSAGTVQADDITCLVVRYLGDGFELDHGLLCPMDPMPEIDVSRAGDPGCVYVF